LLSGFHATIHAPMKPHATPGHVQVHQAQGAGQSTGSGMGITLGPALSNQDVQALQQITEANNAMMFITQLAILKDGDPTVQQASLSLLNDSRNLDLQLDELASSKATPVPSDVSGQAQATAKQALSATNTGSFDQVYKNTLVQAEQQLIGQLQQGTSSQDSDFQSLSRTALTTAQADLAIAQGLQSGNVGSLPNAVNTPSSSTLSSQDLQTLAQSYSGTMTEHFLAQVTALQTNNPNVKNYANKLISDHEQEDVQLGRYAAATGTFLPAAIQGEDIQTSQHVLGSVNRARYVRVYLTQSVKTHTQDIMSNQQTIATTQNPSLKQFAQDDIATDWLHRAGALLLLHRS
jgi:predicted outer membrane protein